MKEEFGECSEAEKNEKRLKSFFKTYFGPNTDELLQKHFVKDFFSEIFERVGAVKILFNFLTPDVLNKDNTEFWGEAIKYVTDVSELVYVHKGLLSKISIDTIQAHWGYPLIQETPLAKTLFDFGLDVFKLPRPTSLMHVSIVLYIGQAYVGTIGPREQKTYYAMPTMFLKLPPAVSLPIGLCADRFTRQLIIEEVGDDAGIVSPLNI